MRRRSPAGWNIGTAAISPPLRPKCPCRGMAKGSFSRHARCGGDSPFAQHFVRQWTIQTRRWRYRDQHAAAAARRLCRRRHAVRAAIRARDGNTDDTGPRARDGLGQLSRRPACRHRARFGDRGRLLPQRVEVRPAQCGTAQPHLPVRAHRRRYRGGRRASPTVWCRSIAAIGSRGLCSASARSSRSNMRWRGRISRNRSAARLPILPPRC